MKNLKKLTRNNLKEIIGGNSPIDEDASGCGSYCGTVGQKCGNEEYGCTCKLMGDGTDPSFKRCSNN